METKHRMDFSKHHTIKTIITGVLLGVFGLSIVQKIDGLAWIQTMPPSRLAIYLVITLLIGTYIHEAYHQLIARLMGNECSVKGFPIASFPTIDNLTKWEAIGLKISPAVDLSLIAGLIIAFLPGPLNPILSIFLIGNLAGSANDLVQAYYIFKLSSRESLIRLTDSGFEILE